MLTFISSSVFSDWLDGLTDQVAKGRVLSRLANAKLGHFGDCQPVGEGISEMRVHVGAGYRIYYYRNGPLVYILLCGGDKSSQKRDVVTAKKLAKDFKKDKQ
jgi:putative addiction module killer protein